MHEYNKFTFLAVDLWIANVSRWTRALRLPVNHPTLRVKAADAVLQARIRANSVFAATFVRLAIVVVVALQLIAFLARLALVALRTQAHRTMIGDATKCIYSAG